MKKMHCLLSMKVHSSIYLQTMTIDYFSTCLSACDPKLLSQAYPGLIQQEEKFKINKQINKRRGRLNPVYQRTDACK